MTWTEDLPEWTETGDEPPAAKKAEGWLPNEKPPAGWFNWLFNRIYASIVELRGTLEGTAGKVLISGGAGEPPTWQDTAPPDAHTHGSITNDGKIGTNANIPIITGTEGVLQAGSFGTSSGTFCEGNDSRLSDARTPTSHTHGNVTNDGKIGTTEDLVIVTGTSGALTAKPAGTSDQFLRGDGSWAEVEGLTDENKIQIRMFGKVI